MSLPTTSGIGLKGYYEAAPAPASTYVSNDSVAVVAPFLAAAAGTSTAGIGVQQANEITFTGIQAVFEKILDEESAVKLLNSFRVKEENGSALAPDSSSNTTPLFNVDLLNKADFKSVLESILTSADEVYGSANLSLNGVTKKVKEYLQEEMRVQIVQQLSSSNLSDMLEASNVSAVNVTLGYTTGATDMADKISAATDEAAAKRKLFMTQIPKTTLDAYIPEAATEIGFLPLRGADSITFIYTLRVEPPTELALIQPAVSSLPGVSSSNYASSALAKNLTKNFLTTDVERRVAFTAHLTNLPAYFLRDSSGNKLESTLTRITAKANDLSGTMASLKSAVDASSSAVPLIAAVNKQTAQSIYAAAIPGYIDLDISYNRLKTIVDGYDASLSNNGLVALAQADVSGFQAIYVDADLTHSNKVALKSAYDSGVASKAQKVGFAQAELASARAIQLDASNNYASAEAAYDEAAAITATTTAGLSSTASVAREAYYAALDTPDSSADISAAYVDFQDAEKALGEALFKMANKDAYSARKQTASGILTAANTLVANKESALGTAETESIPSPTTQGEVDDALTAKNDAQADVTQNQGVLSRVRAERAEWYGKMQAAETAKNVATNPGTVLTNTVDAIDTEVAKFNTLKNAVQVLVMPALTGEATSITAALPVLLGFSTAAISTAMAAYNGDVDLHNSAREAHVLLTTIPIGTKIRPAGLQ
jgi:hypothetical protein